MKTHLLAIDIDGDHRALCGANANAGVFCDSALETVDCKRCLRASASKAQARRDRKDGRK